MNLPHGDMEFPKLSFLENFLCLFRRKVFRFEKLPLQLHHQKFPFQKSKSVPSFRIFLLIVQSSHPFHGKGIETRKYQQIKKDLGDIYKGLIPVFLSLSSEQEEKGTPLLCVGKDTTASIPCKASTDYFLRKLFREKASPNFPFWRLQENQQLTLHSL